MDKMKMKYEKIIREATMTLPYDGEMTIHYEESIYINIAPNGVILIEVKGLVEDPDLAWDAEQYDYREVDIYTPEEWEKLKSQLTDAKNKVAYPEIIENFYEN